MDNLPLELIEHIISYLDTPPPSFEKLVLEPSLDLTVSQGQPLKNLARTSHGLRRVVLPHLFKYTRLHLGLKSSTLNVGDAGNQDSSQSRKENYNMPRPGQIPRPSRRATTTHDEVARPPQPDHRAFLEFITSQRFQKHVKSLVMSTSEEAYLEDPSGRYRGYRDALPGVPGFGSFLLWNAIFSVLNPPRLVLLAPPKSLAYLLDVPIHLADAWAFEIPYQLLELRQNDNGDAGPRRASLETPQMHVEARQNPLSARRWEHLLLNEGSHLKAYSTYEYFLKEAPSIAQGLLSMLGYYSDNDRRFGSFTYISVFPFYTHMEKIYRTLGTEYKQGALIRPASIHIKLAPDPLENHLGNPKRQGRADLNDCWSEFESSYSILAYMVKRLGRAGHLNLVSSGDYSVDNIKAIIDCYMGNELEGWTESELGAWKKTKRDTSLSEP